MHPTAGLRPEKETSPGGFTRGDCETFHIQSLPLDL
jgi:hypothetical protein